MPLVVNVLMIKQGSVYSNLSSLHIDVDNVS